MVLLFLTASSFQELSVTVAMQSHWNIQKRLSSPNINSVSWKVAQRLCIVLFPGPPGCIQPTSHIRRCSKTWKKQTCRVSKDRKREEDVEEEESAEDTEFGAALLEFTDSVIAHQKKSLSFCQWISFLAVRWRVAGGRLNTSNFSARLPTLLCSAVVWESICAVSTMKSDCGCKVLY